MRDTYPLEGQRRLNQAFLAVDAVPLPGFPGSLAVLFARPGARVYEIFPVIEGGSGGSAGLRGWRLIWLAASVGFSQECDSWSDLLVFVRPVLILAAGFSVVGQAGLVPQSEVMGHPFRPLSGQRERTEKGAASQVRRFEWHATAARGFPTRRPARRQGIPPCPLFDGQSAAWHHLGSKPAEWVSMSGERPRATESLSGARWLCIYIMRMWSLDGLCCRCPCATPSLLLSSFSCIFYITG